MEPNNEDGVEASADVGYSSGELAFLLLPASKVDDDLLKQCANLFSNHYGIWGPNAAAAGMLEPEFSTDEYVKEDGDPGGEVKPGSRVKMSVKRLRSQCLHHSKRCYVVAAIQPATDQVIAHAFYTRFYYAPGKGDVMWITQIVVHTDWRRMGVGQRLCRLAWNGANTFACGLVSPHPFAVRCLERMAGVRCDLTLTQLHGPSIAAACGIDFVSRSRLVLNQSTSILQSNFFVDRPAEVADPVATLQDWQLGPLKDGQEYFALCFPASKLTDIPQSRRSRRRFFHCLTCCSLNNHVVV